MAREDLHFRLRIPEDLKRQIETEAERHARSMTAEIIERIKESFLDPVVLPSALYERVRMYAARNNRTANDEIIRLLEREFPVQWPASDRLEYLADLLGIIKTAATDDAINNFTGAVEETLEGVASGRVTGLEEATRKRLVALWQEYKDRENWADYEAAQNEMAELDEEEVESMERNHTTEKFADRPISPKAPFNPDDDEIPF
ncbi:Arc family DNA-binding protein [Shinella sp.]|uniref:Arc family DNA-binding protein n=1 Tax=Shinella sp. TaxID=1870904 RepID=UPI0028A6ADC6|nr:Arc family DNA-binding protein [Shinella sp.]